MSLLMPRCFQFISWDLELLFYNDPIRAHLGVFLDFVDAFILYKQILCLCAPFKNPLQKQQIEQNNENKVYTHFCTWMYMLILYMYV